MRKIILYIVLLLLTLTAASQTNNTRSLRIANSETAFGRQISRGDRIVDISTSDIFLVSGNISDTSTIDNSTNLIYLNPWNFDAGLNQIYPKKENFHFGLQNYSNVRVDSIVTKLINSDNALVTGSGIYEFVTGLVNNETTKKIFSLELEENQTYVNIGFSLVVTSAITINGISLKPYQWDGIGSNIITLKINVKQYDYLIILN